MLHSIQWRACKATRLYFILVADWAVLCGGCWPAALWVQQGISERWPGEEYILFFFFISVCVSDWLLLEAAQLHNRTHVNAASLAACQGFHKGLLCVREEGRGWTPRARIVCVHLHPVLLLCGVAGRPADCVLLEVDWLHTAAFSERTRALNVSPAPLKSSVFTSVKYVCFSSK